MRLEITDTQPADESDPPVRSLDFEDTPVLIGSNEGCNLHLPDTDVSAYHGMIAPLADDLWVYHQIEPDGRTLINNEPVTEPVELESGQVIVIGRFQIKFTLEDASRQVLPEALNLEELARIRDYPLPHKSKTFRPETDFVVSPRRQHLVCVYADRIRRCAELPQLVEAAVDIVLREFGARSAWIGLRRKDEGDLEFTGGMTDDGVRVETPWKLDTFLYRCLTRHQLILIPRTREPLTQSLLAVPVMDGRNVLGLMMADTRKHTLIFSKDDVGFAAQIGRFVGAQIEAILQNRVQQVSEQKEDRLAALREAQLRLLASGLAQWPSLLIAAASHQGTKRVGDFYDAVKLPNGLAAIITGHVDADPLQTALAMAQIHSLFKLACMHADPPHVVFKALNLLLARRDHPCAVHAAMIVMNPKTGAAEYCTAGEMGAIIIDAFNMPRKIRQGDVPPIGASRDYDYAGAKERVAEGQTLVFYTRGIAAVRDRQGNQLKTSRFVQTLCEESGQAPATVIEETAAALSPFMKDGEFPDDVTILVAYRPSGASA